MVAASTFSPTVVRWYIALELSRLRRDAGLTMKQVAERLGCSTGHVGHLETGRNLPGRAELEVLLDFYQAGERIPVFVDYLASARGGRDWWRPFEGAAPAWLELFLGLERAASQIESYDAQVVAGLLQTPAYAEAVIRAGDPELPEAELARRIELRQARQEVLTREPRPPSVWSILDESVLHSTAGDPKVMAEQLEHLVKVSELPTVTVLVLRMSTRPHAGMDGMFKILSFPHLVGAPAVAYTDGRVRGSYYEDPAAVLKYRNALTRLHNLAVNPEESRRMLRNRVKELR
jgi:transcriptional regulator with XRE-family HTH domain